MKFTKMQGAGNDYIYVDCFQETVQNPEKTAIFVSNRHFGIGSDGLVLIWPSESADVKMRMFNADGSEGIMCGNAVRCVGKYVYDHDLVKKEILTVETLGGIKVLKLETEAGKVVRATVDMGVPEITSTGVPESICIEGENQEFVGISIGNPHAVYFVKDIETLKLKEIGPFYENHHRFPDRVNSEFVEVITRSDIRMRVWERGSGETLACGTGATASAVASILMGYTDDKVKVSLQGGDLLITWNRNTGHAFMTGPAVEVFHGEIDIPDGLNK